MHFLLYLYLFIFSSLLHPHGFAENTIVLCKNRTSKHINHLKNKTPIYSYHTHLDKHTTITIKDRGYSTTDHYINLIINNDVTITCTPTQEFYLAQHKQWVPAHKLQAGDYYFALIMQHNR